MFATILLLASPALQEANEAEQLYRKMEETLGRAKTLIVTFEATERWNHNGNTAKGRLIFAEGNRLRLDIESRHQGKEIAHRYASDGTSFRSRLPKQDSQKIPAPAGLRDRIRAAFSRRGTSTASQETAAVFQIASAKSASGNAPPDVSSDLRDRFAVNGFRLGAVEKVGDRDCRKVECAPADLKEGETGMLTVWIDTERHLPVQRTWTFRNEREKLRIETTETCEIRIDEKIDEETFTLNDSGR